MQNFSNTVHQEIGTVSYVHIFFHHLLAFQMLDGERFKCDQQSDCDMVGTNTKCMVQKQFPKIGLAGFQLVHPQS